MMEFLIMTISPWYPGNPEIIAKNPQLKARMLKSQQGQHKNPRG
jgi:hypothetical protein